LDALKRAAGAPATAAVTPLATNRRGHCNPSPTQATRHLQPDARPGTTPAALSTRSFRSSSERSPRARIGGRARGKHA